VSAAAFVDMQTQQHLRVVCRWIDALLHRQVLRLRMHRECTPEDFRGLCIADAEVDLLLASSAAEGGAATEIDSVAPVDYLSSVGEEESAALWLFPDSALSRLCSRFSLDDFERHALMLAVAPELDLRYQTLFAYVQNDVTRKLPTIDLVLKLLCGTREEQWAARQRLSPHSPLFQHLLLQVSVETAARDATQLASSLRVPGRVTEFLLGQTSIDEGLAESTTLILRGEECLEEGACGTDLSGELASAASLLGDSGVMVLRGRDGAGKFQVARQICGGLDKPLVVCDLRGEVVNPRTAALLRRECRLLDAGLYLQLGAVVPEKQRLYADLAKTLSSQPFPIFLSIEDPEAPAPDIVSGHYFRIDLTVPHVDLRRSLWERELGPPSDLLLHDEMDQLAAEFRFTPGQLRAVAREARSISLLQDRGSRVIADDIRQAARNRCNTRLRGLAQRIDHLFSWDDLILPGRVVQQLREICASVNLRHVVQARWGFDSKTGKDAGINVLFSGASGTGKTMAAGVLARSLGLELYKVDLSCIVSKYVGETEQNLRRVFDEAEHSSAVLFFDEADALFGKRSEVKDAQDRYANIEVAYLLQKMEQFPGLAVLATNLNRNIDAAFLRRLQHVVEFPFPDALHRERIWQAMFPERAPRSDDVDFAFLSKQFELSGGNIRNAVTAGAYLAAEHGEAIGMEHLVRGVAREMQKLGKLPSKAEFQGHMDVISRQGNSRQLQKEHG
jgi:hypothetical protein